MRKWVATAIALGVLSLWGAPAMAGPFADGKPVTILLVHGAFAGSSSWNPVISRLQSHGYRTIAVANPLRSLSFDADYLLRVARSVDGPVVLVGHSYGGEVISVAGAAATNARALVFVAGLAPETGESAASLSARFPTGTLGQTLAPAVPQADGARDLYIRQDKYRDQFAPDVPAADAAQMAATQRPITEGALSEPAAGPPAWKTLPSWFVYGSADKNIPRALHDFMARRAGARENLEVPGASHVVMLSHPDKVAAMIERAASAE